MKERITQKHKCNQHFPICLQMNNKFKQNFLFVIWKLEKVWTLLSSHLWVKLHHYCPTWAMETVLSPWLAADEGRVSHVLSHVVWWK